MGGSEATGAKKTNKKDKNKRRRKKVTKRRRVNNTFQTHFARVSAKAIEGVIIKSCRVRAMWLGNNDILASFGSVFTYAVSGIPLVHQWVEIETSHPRVFFLLALDGNSFVYLNEFGSTSAVDRLGMLGGLADGSTQKSIWNVKVWEYETGTEISLAEICDWASEYVSTYGRYKLTSNNCQTFCTKFWRQFHPTIQNKSKKTKKIKKEKYLCL